MFFVKDTQKSIEGQRIYDSRHACLFCGLMQPKIGRHIRTYVVEQEIKNLKMLIPKSKECKKKLKQLRLKGDFYHNVKVLKTGGEMVVARRPPHGTKAIAKDYLPCKHCYAFIHQTQLTRHCKRCDYRPSEATDEDEGIVKQCELLIYPNESVPGASLELEEFVLQKMKKDEVTDVVKKDLIIVTYGSFLLNGKGRKGMSEVSQCMCVNC